MQTLIRFEIKKWLQNKAAWATCITWIILTAFAVQSRSVAVRKAMAQNDSGMLYEKQKEKAYYSLLDSTDRQLKQITAYENDPHNPVYFNVQVPRFAIYKPGPLDLFATGQSDLFPQLYVITYRTDYRQQKEEAANGMQLLYGKFDVAFLIVFLLPLIIIAFNYNALSSEKEGGTLKLLLVQKAGLKQILFSKLIVSFVFTFLLLFVPPAAVWLSGNRVSLASCSMYLLAGILYSIFWHLLAALVNSRLKSSAYNAALLTGCWLLLAIIFPAVVNLFSDSVHPVPSRSQFIIAYRQAMNHIEQDSNSAVLDKYFFEHPELVKEDTAGNTRNRANRFYKAYHAEHDKTQTTLQPLYDDYANKLKSANRFSNALGLVSPAIIINQSLLLLAGQSSRQYLWFNEKINEWRYPYLKFILTRLMQDKDINKEDALQWKAFSYTPYNYSPALLINLAALLLFNIILLLFVYGFLKKAIVV